MPSVLVTKNGHSVDGATALKVLPEFLGRRRVVNLQGVRAVSGQLATETQQHVIIKCNGVNLEIFTVWEYG